MGERLLRGIQNYEVKLRLGAAGRLSEDEIKTRVSNYSAAAVRENQFLDIVRQKLCSHGVATITFPYYHAFSRELAKLTRQEMGRESAMQECAKVLAKWIARGLEQAVLEEIAFDVFNLSMPEPPNEERGEEGQDQKA